MNDTHNFKNDTHNPKINSESFQNKNRHTSLLHESVLSRFNIDKLSIGRTLEAIEIEIPDDIRHMNAPVYAQQPAETIARPAAQLVLQQSVAPLAETTGLHTEVAEPTIMAYPQAAVAAAAQLESPNAANQTFSYDKSASVLDAQQQVLNSLDAGNQATYHEFLKAHPRELFAATPPEADAFQAIGYKEINESNQNEFELAA